MNPSTYSATGSGVALLAQVIVWATTWPVHTPTMEQASALAALSLALFASVHGMLNARKNGAAEAGAPVKSPDGLPSRPTTVEKPV